MNKIAYFWTCFSLLLLATAGCKQEPADQPPTTYVLVHGAWQGPFVWQSVAQSLRQAGQVVEVVELPAHGADQTPPAAVTLSSYRDKVVSIIGATTGRVVLVGHSFGGMVASAVAEQIPDRIAKVVYLAGYVPASGQSLLTLALSDTASRVLPALVSSADGLTLGIEREQIVPLFCPDCSPAAGQQLIDGYRPEPSIPPSNTVALSTASFGRVAKCYIYTTQDRAISPVLQRRMVATAGITEVYSLTSGHTAQLSVPGQVSDLLLRLR